MGSFENNHLISTTITKMKSFVAFVALLAVANAEVKSHATVKHGHSAGYSHAVAHAPSHPAPAYKPAPVYHPAPVYKPAPAYHAPAYHAPAYKEPAYADVPAKYQYEYRVAVPDCRTQIVKYNTADGYSGNVVEVTYEGTPCYDTYKPVHKAPAYHAPAPVYKPAPTYHA